jgi:hypothetical protein
MSLQENKSRFNISDKLFGGSELMVDSFDSTNVKNKSFPEYTSTDIANHDSSENCWISIKNNVYNMSSYKRDIQEKLRNNGIQEKIDLGITCGNGYNNLRASNIFRFEPNKWDYRQPQEDADVDKEQTNKDIWGNKYNKPYQVGKVKNFHWLQIRSILLKLAIIGIMVAILIKTKRIIILVPIILYVMYYGNYIYTIYSEKVMVTEGIHDKIKNL